MSDPGASLNQWQEVETGEAFTIQNPRLLKVELSETSVMAQERRDGRLPGPGALRAQGRRARPAAQEGGDRREPAAHEGVRAPARCSSPRRRCSCTSCGSSDDALTVNGSNILAFEAGIDWDVTRVKGGAAGMLAGGLFNIHLRGTGLVALVSDGEPIKLDVAEAPTFGDPQAAIAWSSGVTTTLKTDVQAKRLIGMGSGESIQIGFQGQGWVLIQPSEGRIVPTA